MDEHPDAQAALAISVDYYGLMDDLPAIARAVHARGKLLLCDEAHGASFNWRSGMEESADIRADGLPYGQQRKLEICRALATNPKVLLLDEPAAGMGIVGGNQRSGKFPLMAIGCDQSIRHHANDHPVLNHL